MIFKRSKVQVSADEWKSFDVLVFVLPKKEYKTSESVLSSLNASQGVKKSLAAVLARQTFPLKANKCITVDNSLGQRLNR